MIVAGFDNRLFCGDSDDAEHFAGRRICVLESMPSVPCLWVPLLQLAKDSSVVVRPNQLALIVGVVSSGLEQSGRVLVFCAAGLERSPLVVAWWLHKTRAMKMADAYAILQSLNPKIRNCEQWISRRSDDN